jgi:hypothetical protein
MFSYTTALLLLMQDVADITHAHFYSGGGDKMALFGIQRNTKEVLLNKALMSFYIHKNLKDSEKVKTKVCTEKVCGKYSYLDNFVARGFKSKSGYKIVLVNDSADKVKSTVDLSGLTRVVKNKTQTVFLPDEKDIKIPLKAKGGVYILDQEKESQYIKNSIKRYDIDIKQKGMKKQLDVYLLPYSVIVVNFR